MLKTHMSYHRKYTPAIRALRLRRGFYFFTLLSPVFLLSAGCSASQEPLSTTQFLFDTICEITIYDGDQELLDQCVDQMRYFENTLSRTREGSDVWKINHAQGQGVEVSEDTLRILETGLAYGDKTDGLFDISIAPVVDLWDFQPLSDPVLPDQKDIDKALSHVNYKSVHVEGNTVTLSDPEGAVDFGAIAKGYISDCIYHTLKDGGCTSALINLGGNVMTVGSKPDGSPWRIGIKKPFPDEKSTLIQVVECSDQAIITSGTYERCFELDGVLYHHVLDPSTGWPVDSELASVSILTSNGMLGDTLSTCCLLLGLEKGMALIEDTPEVEALFITNDGQTHASSGWTGTAY